MPVFVEPPIVVDLQNGSLEFPQYGLTAIFIGRSGKDFRQPLGAKPMTQPLS